MRDDLGRGGMQIVFTLAIYCDTICFPNFSRASHLGCPRNNQIFFGSNRNKPKLNLFRLFFGLFCKTKKHFFRFVSVCFDVSVSIETIETNRIFSKQTEIISKKRSLIGGLQNRKFFSRFEPKPTETQSVSVVFLFAFSRNQKLFSGLFRSFGPVSKQPKQTELMVWGIKKVDI
jgi:hypothetical protein